MSSLKKGGHFEMVMLPWRRQNRGIFVGCRTLKWLELAMVTFRLHTFHKQETIDIEMKSVCSMFLEKLQGATLKQMCTSVPLFQNRNNFLL